MLRQFYWLIFFIIYQANYIRTELSLNFYMDCDNKFTDQSTNERFVQSFGVARGKNRNGKINPKESSCSFSDHAYIKADGTNFPSTDMTISFWLKITASNNNPIFSFYKSNYGFLLKTEDSKFKLMSIITNNPKESWSSDYSSNDWNEITISISKQKVVLAINQTQTELTPKESIPLMPETTFYIGYDPQAMTYMTGGIDNFRIYSGYLAKQSLELNELITSNYCEETQAYTGNSCEECSKISNCQTCQNLSKCKTCNSGFYLNTTGNCLCQKESCQECNTDGSCKTCEPGYSLNERKNCILNQCPQLDYCIKCVDQVCIQCIGDYIIKDDKCELHSSAIIGVVVTFLVVLFIMWIVIIVLIRPKLI